MITTLLLIRFPKLDSRTLTEVCKRYQADKAKPNRNAQTYFPDQRGSCSIQSYNRQTDDQIAITELNLFRWLMGFDRKVQIANKHDLNQTKCAIWLAVNKQLAHDISGGKCSQLTQTDGCKKSNIAYNFNGKRSADLLSQFFDDYSEISLGLAHRRWCLDPDMVTTSFGGAYDSTTGITALAMRTMAMGYYSDGQGGEQLPFTAHPAPGYFPTTFIYRRWSFWGEFVTQPCSVIVKINGVTANIKLTQLYKFSNWQNGCDFELIGYDDPKTLIGKNVEVKITDGAGKVYEYTVKPVDCDSWSEYVPTPKPKTPTPYIPTPKPKTPTPYVPTPKPKTPTPYVPTPKPKTPTTKSRTSSKSNAPTYRPTQPSSGGQSGSLAHSYTIERPVENPGGMYGNESELMGKETIASKQKTNNFYIGIAAAAVAGVIVILIVVLVVKSVISKHRQERDESSSHNIFLV